MLGVENCGNLIRPVRDYAVANSTVAEAPAAGTTGAPETAPQPSSAPLTTSAAHHDAGPAEAQVDEPNAGGKETPALDWPVAALGLACLALARRRLA